MNDMKQRGNRAGFSLVEVLIVVSILAILAAMIIPRFTNATVVTQAGATKETLRATRVALDRYKLDHNDSYPDITELWSVLTEKTDRDGTLNPAGHLGPYIKSVPLNPFTDSTTVVGFGAGTATDGWEYDPTEQPPLIAVGFDEDAGTYTAP